MIGPGAQYRPIDLEITKLELIAGDIVKYSHRTDVRVGFEPDLHTAFFSLSNSSNDP